MSHPHAGKLFIRFIKDLTNVIMEPQQIPKPVIKKDFYMWFGTLPKEDKKLKVILPALPKFDSLYYDTKKKEKIQQKLKDEGRAIRPCEIIEGKGTWKKNETPLWWYP